MKTKVKNILKQIWKVALLLPAMVICACSEDYLEPAPISAISALNFYSDETELEAGVINMYDGIQGINSNDTDDLHGIQREFYLTEMRSDNTKTKSSEGEAAEFENFNITPNNGIVADYYASFYNIIFRANVVLENLGVASAAKAALFEGEAKFVRAYAYFNLVRLYGDIPLVDRLINPLDKETAFTRVPTSTIYDLIESDLTTAVANLDNTYRSRASQAAAQALLAKVYLTRGNNYDQARSLLEGVMSAGYSLETNFQDIFFQELNDEIIFAIGYLPDNSDDSQNFSAEWLNAVGRTTGVNYVTDEAATALDVLGGDRTMYSYRIDATQPEFNQVVKYIPDGDEDLGIAAVSSNPVLAGNDWIVLRYADVLLMHVEAIMAGGTDTSDPAALASFQAVRDRAGLTDLVTNVTKQELLAERRVELAFENHRLFDLIRFGEAITVLGNFATDNGFSFSETDLLLPIPQREINLSQGLLTQNSGY